MKTIICTGKDGLIHHCVPWEDKTLCGMPIDKKGEDHIKFGERLWCCCCDYMVEDIEHD